MTLLVSFCTYVLLIYLFLNIALNTLMTVYVKNTAEERKDKVLRSAIKYCFLEVMWLLHT